MSYLRRFPFDKIKIDKSFLADESGECIVKAITGLARSLGRCIAEGVQTEKQLKMVAGDGSEEAQCFLLGEPVPADEFVTRFGYP